MDKSMVRRPSSSSRDACMHDEHGDGLGAHLGLGWGRGRARRWRWCVRVSVASSVVAWRLLCTAAVAWTTEAATSMAACLLQVNHTVEVSGGCEN